jgi:hypothetical protein
MTKTRTLALIALCMIGLSIVYTRGGQTAQTSSINPNKYPQVSWTETETPEQKEQRMKWFTDARFGMFIHWGIYSQWAGTGPQAGRQSGRPNYPK